ncbi:flagellar basal body P-ring formation chaperone FlgA [Hyphomicrobium sp.]|uniref:flagellar basal body P-ring formation chaperone FlgA n=1 Tax=Hyphomicrobium sp. TaxID=82 RepID=UPI001D54E1D9|nr:flagellar basal body P-ring formation chaperone FlgA [Hyphomicrobium sp.]MBY0562044.1 flagellar basal body P-ring formation chaperone FlgA [Hyphomicrobium sp.]
MIGLRSMRNTGGFAAAALLAIFAASAVVHATEGGRTVFVPRAVIYPGDVITSEALMERKLLVAPNNPPVFGERSEELLGKVARRTLLPNELIPGTAVKTPDLIKQGKTYKLTYESQFVSIIGVGVPLQSGSVGEIINVRNPDTGLIIKARIKADQTLTVDDQ